MQLSAGHRRLAFQLVARTAFFASCSYGLLYFAYKYYHPWLGGTDFVQYYKIYLNPLDNAARAPYRYHFISAWTTFLIYKLGLYYPSEISFQHPAYSQRVFFAALFSNYLGLIGAAVTCSFIVREKGLAPILAGLLVIASFGTSVFVMTGMTEGWSWFLIAVGFLFYSRRCYPGLWLVLLLSAFQRETILVVFAVFAGVDLWQRQTTDDAWPLRITVLLCLAAFLLYRMLPVFDPPPVGHSHPMAPRYLWHQWISFRLDSAFVFQAVLSQNLLWLYALLALSLKFQKRQPAEYALHLALATVALTAGGIGIGIGSNTGRIVMILTPIMAPLASSMMARLDL